MTRAAFALTIGLLVTLLVLGGGTVAIAAGGFALLPQLAARHNSPHRLAGMPTVVWSVFVGLLVLLPLGAAGCSTGTPASNSHAGHHTPPEAKVAHARHPNTPLRARHPGATPPRPPAAARALGTATKTVACRVRGRLPDPACTPGAVFASATRGQICTPGYSKQARHVSNATRVQVYAAYGITTHVGYEVDHLIPLEAGGSNAVANLWPQRGYAAKDRLENQVHRDICADTTPLRQAQRQLAHNWVKLARHDGINPTAAAPRAPAPAPPTPPSSSPTPSAGGDKNCSDFSTHQQAQQYFTQNGGSPTNDVDGLDRNSDGIACSSLP